MIQYVTGDILLSTAKVLVHGVAPNDHFTQGLALAMRERWPAMAKDFRHWCHQAGPKPGEAWVWSGPGLRIVNLLTQEPAPNQHTHPGRAKVEHVNHALRALHHLISKTPEEYPSLAIPRLATGVGGLKWEEVKPLIEHHLGALKMPIQVYENYRSGVSAGKPG